MKKIIIFAAMAAMFSLASCQKDEVVANNEAKVSPVFTASINAGTTKTTVNVTTGKIAWESTDEITVTDNSGNSAVYEIESIAETTGKATFKLKSGQSELGDGPYTATYGSAPSTYQTYSTAAGKLYMTAPATSNNSFTFTVQCGLMKINLSKSGETITNIAVTGTPTGGTTKMTYTMYCPGGVDISSAKDFFIALPAGSYDKIEVYKHDATNGFMVCSLIPSTSIAISANHIKPVNASSSITFSECQNLPGLFSVSNDGGATIKQIRFSKGNLVATINANGTLTDWKFATNQYDCLGEGGANKTIGAAAGDVDLFGWSTSTSGTETTDNYGIKTSTTISDYSGNFYDWGKAYCASKSISPDNTWRTLSTAEWQYLFNDGSYTSDVRNGKYIYGVNVCGKANCIVLLPDDWAWNASTVGTDWQKNTSNIIEYSEETAIKWSTMQAAGAVCLPAAGSRNDSHVGEVGDGGSYWSSTATDDSRACNVIFYSDFVSPGSASVRNYGYSVRLITVCQ